MILRDCAHTCTLTEDRVSVEASELMEGGVNHREDEDVALTSELSSKLLLCFLDSQTSAGSVHLDLKGCFGPLTRASTSRGPDGIRRTDGFVIVRKKTNPFGLQRDTGAGF